MDTYLCWSLTLWNSDEKVCTIINSVVDTKDQHKGSALIGKATICRLSMTGLSVSQTYMDSRHIVSLGPTSLYNVSAFMGNIITTTKLIFA